MEMLEVESYLDSFKGSIFKRLEHCEEKNYISAFILEIIRIECMHANFAILVQVINFAVD